MNDKSEEPELKDAEEFRIEDSVLHDLYCEILANVRKDREAADELLVNLVEMVQNGGICD